MRSNNVRVNNIAKEVGGEWRVQVSIDRNYVSVPIDLNSSLIRLFVR